MYVVSPSERRDGMPMRVVDEGNAHILSVRTLKVQKTSIIEKGLGQVSIEWLYKRAIKKHFAGVKFDLILYSTPPITLMGGCKGDKTVEPQGYYLSAAERHFPSECSGYWYAY